MYPCLLSKWEGQFYRFSEGHERQDQEHIDLLHQTTILYIKRVTFGGGAEELGADRVVRVVHNKVAIIRCSSSICIFTNQPHFIKQR